MSIEAQPGSKTWLDFGGSSKRSEQRLMFFMLIHLFKICLIDFRQFLMLIICLDINVFFCATLVVVL